MMAPLILSAEHTGIKSILSDHDPGSLASCLSVCLTDRLTDRLLTRRDMMTGTVLILITVPCFARLFDNLK